MTTTQPILTDGDLAWMRALSRRGFAVAVFTPEELGNANPKWVEDYMIECGWNAIEMNQVEEDTNDPE